MGYRVNVIDESFRRYATNILGNLVDALSLIEKAMPWLSMGDHIVILGQSQGGWVSLAASTIPMKRVLGAVNISGAVNFKQGIGLGIRSRTVEDSLKHSAFSVWTKCQSADLVDLRGK